MSTIGSPGGTCVAGDPVTGYPGCVLSGRYGTFAVSPTIAQAGQTLTMSWSLVCALSGPDKQPGDPGCAVHTIDWSTSITALGLPTQSNDGSGNLVTSGCTAMSLTCTVKIPAGTPTTRYFGVTGAFVWDGGFCVCGEIPVAYLDARSSLISGNISDRNHLPLANLGVRLSGTASDFVTTSSQGNFAFVVPRGNYVVTPAPIPGSQVSFTPGSRTVRITSGQTRRGNNFVANGGLDVSLTFSSESTSASGFQILGARVFVKRFGRPAPGVTLALWPKSTEEFTHAVSTGARATLCSPTGRLWPGGSLANPANPSVDVTTNANGVYRFTINVGTVPGVFPITAWARSADGTLASGPGSSDTASFTISGDTTARADAFFGGLHLIPASKFAPLLGVDTMVDLATFVDATNATPNIGLSGLAYAPINGNGAFIVYPSSQPPSVDATGAVTAHDTDLVFEPDLWVAPDAISNIGYALQHGTVTSLPTFAQWSVGKETGSWLGSVSPRQAQVPSAAFHYYGWPYPRQAPGSCD